ncbi:hypothetical protein CHARACLAT_011266 [Characodon lateralis]|uniref:Uncharacterized protein n=1 Tax=Characodon lateralis TaxID=208331 RepID=A0ABU7CQK0_9TELE|nr:hypothetical protein [Characodon lateralis]
MMFPSIRLSICPLLPHLSSCFYLPETRMNIPPPSRSLKLLEDPKVFPKQKGLIGPPESFLSALVSVPSTMFLEQMEQSRGLPDQVKHQELVLSVIIQIPGPQVKVRPEERRHYCEQCSDPAALSDQHSGTRHQDT